jgi:glycosyltransferase 2 family protein
VTDATTARSGASPRTLWLVVWAALSVAIVWAAASLPWRQVLTELARVHPAWLVTALALDAAILPAWAAEWRLLVPRRERPRAGAIFETVALTATTLNTMPFFAGEAAAVVLLVARAGLSRGAALSVLALDQLLVGVAKLGVLAVAALYAPIPAWTRAGVLSLVTAVALLAAALLVVAHGAERRVDRLAPGGGRRRDWARRLAGWAVHLDALRSARRSGAVVLLAVLKKALEIAAVLAAQHALGVALPWWSGVLVVAALGISTMLPLAPANLGVYEATVFLVYRELGVGAERALSLAIVQHACMLAPMIGTGYLLLTARQLRARAATQ